MKKFSIISFLLLLTLFVNAQESRKYYCEIKGIEKGLTTGLKIVFDFGNSKVYSFWEGLSSKQKLVDEDGEEIEFNSMVDAGNYLSGKGWTFVQAYSSDYGGQSIVHWIFVKEASTPEDAVKGLMTKDIYNKSHKG